MAAGSFIATRAACASSSPRSPASRSTSQSGYESATASLGGSGHGGPSLGERAQDGVAEPARPRRSLPRARRPSPTPRRGAARRGAVGTRRGGVRRAREGRAGGGAASPHASRGRRGDAALSPSHRRGRSRRRDARSRKFESRSIDGTSTCAYAPSSIRTSASSASNREEVTSRTGPVHLDDRASTRHSTCAPDLRAALRGARTSRRRPHVRAIP